MCIFHTALSGETLADLCSPRKYPQFDQSEIFRLQDTFGKLDAEDKGYIDEATAIKSTEHFERLPYDFVRSVLKQVDLDSSRRVAFEDYVDVRKFVIPFSFPILAVVNYRRR